MDTKSIPTLDGGAIAEDKDSITDTQVNETETQKTDSITEDSSKDTQSNKDDILDELQELKAIKADIEREKFETDKAKVEADPNYLKKLGETNPKRANKIVSRLTDGKFTDYTELLEAYEKEAKYSEIENEKVKELVQWKDEQEKAKQLEAKRRQESEWEEAKAELYKAHPEIAPDNDKGNSKWSKLKQELDSLNINKLGFKKSLNYAYKLAFDELDNNESRALLNSNGALPSSGGVIDTKPTNLTEQEQIEKKFESLLKPVFRK